MKTYKYFSKKQKKASRKWVENRKQYFRGFLRGAPSWWENLGLRG